MKKLAISSIKSLGKQETFNLTMKSSQHNYALPTKNGIIFSKNSHAAGYALLSFHTAWCKAYYPEHYMAECFNYETFDKYKLFVEDCKRMGIPVLPPSVSFSKPQASVELFDGNLHFKHTHKEVIYGGIRDGTKCVRLGFQLVKGVGGSVSLHKNAPYTDILDFVTKNKGIDAGSLEALAKCGALDEFGITRNDLIKNLPNLLQVRKSIKDSNVQDVFGALSADERSSFISLEVSNTPVTDQMLMSWESEYLGYCFTTNFYVAYHHLVKDRERIGSILHSEKIEGEVSFVGLVYSAKPYRKEVINKETKEKEKKLMLFLKIGDFDEQIEIGIFEDGLRRSAEQMNIPLSADIIRPNDLVLVIGSKKYNGRFNTTRIEVLERR